MATDFAQWVDGLDAKRRAKEGDLSARSGLSVEDEGEGHALPGGDAGAGVEKTAAEKLEELQQEMKLLHWHKLANEAALKAAIIKTRRLKARETSGKGAVRQQEKAAWMQQVIQEEQGKPLEVSEDFIREFKAQEKVDDRRVEADMGRHVKNLRGVKDDLIKREEVRRRNHAYKKKKDTLQRRELAVQQQSLAKARAATLDAAAGAGADSLLLSPSVSSANAGPAGNAEPSTSSAGAGGSRPETTTSTGSEAQNKVATSLDRLVELEKRISLLEREYDDDGVPSSTVRPRKVVFAKHLVGATATEPARSMYHVRVNRHATSAAAARGNKKKLKGKRQPRALLDDDGFEGAGSEASAFMTGLPDIPTSKRPRHQRAQSQSDERGQLVRYTPSKKVAASRVKSRLRGARKQDQAVHKYLTDRHPKGKGKLKANANANAKTRPKVKRRGPTSQSGAGGDSRALVVASRASTGPRQKAKDRLKEFRDVRKQFDRKKEVLNKSLHAKSDGSVRRSKQMAGRRTVAARSRAEVAAARRSGPGIRAAGGGARGPGRLGHASFLRGPGDSGAVPSLAVAKKKRSAKASSKLVGRNGSALRSTGSTGKASRQPPARHPPAAHVQVQMPQFGVVGKGPGFPRLGNT